MNEKSEQNIIHSDINTEFENNISLNKLVGNKAAAESVKLYIESYYNDLSDKQRKSVLDPILLVGDYGKTVFAMAAHNYFGNTSIRTISGQWLTEHVMNIHNFFADGNRHTSYFITDADKMDSDVQYYLYTILYEKRLSTYDFGGKLMRPRFDNRLIVLSAKKTDVFDNLLLSRMGLIVNLSRLSIYGLVQMLKQRIDLLGWKISSEKILNDIAKSAVNEPAKAIETLSKSYIVMRGRNETVLTGAHVSKALHLIKENRKSAKEPNE